MLRKTRNWRREVLLGTSKEKFISLVIDSSNATSVSGEMGRGVRGIVRHPLTTDGAIRKQDRSFKNQGPR